MTQSPAKQSSRDLIALMTVAFIPFLVHTLTNSQYGFHRDELQTLDDARHMAWGFVAYPPVTPGVARVALALFGNSLVGLRFFSCLALSAATVLTGLMTRELGGSRRAQVLAALSAAISPIVLIQGSVFQYVALDFLWMVMITYFLVRLLKSDGPRWWPAIGAVIGLGMMTKYTMGFYALGIAGAVLATGTRRHLLSRWLWLGVALSLVVFLPNVLWQAHHNFISLDFLRYIHERDIRWGRTQGFLPDQLGACINIVTLPLVLAGLSYYLFRREGAKFRALGWLFVITFLLFFVARSRAYYTASLYPMLLASGSLLWNRWIGPPSKIRGHLMAGSTWAVLILGGAAFALIAFPWAPVHSELWNATYHIHDNFAEEIGWTDLIENVAKIYQSLPPEEQARTGILAGNYGETGAIDLYGPAHNLPSAISGTNSAWLRGYGPGPQILIVVGLSKDYLQENFQTCDLVGHNTNRYGVVNEESRDHPEIYLCKHLLQPWPEFWRQFRHYG